MAKMTMAEVKAKPRKLTEAERARLAAMTDKEIERNAATDEINPAWSDERLDRAISARNPAPDQLE